MISLNSFQKKVFNKLTKIQGFSHIIESDFLNKTNLIEEYMQAKYQTNFESKQMEEWTPILCYFSYIYSKPSNPTKQIIGIQGPQGSGKSTMSLIICNFFKDFLGRRTECISIDDFYLTYEERQKRKMAFRGPPGTHDFDLLDSFFDQFYKKQSGSFLCQYIFAYWG